MPPSSSPFPTGSPALPLLLALEARLRQPRTQEGPAPPARYFHLARLRLPAEPSEGRSLVLKLTTWPLPHLSHTALSGV